MSFRGVLLLFSAGLLAVGCGGGSSGSITIRTVNFVRGSSTNSVNVTAETVLLATQLAYGTPTGYNSLSNFPQTISASDTASSTNLGSLNLSATSGNFYTLYVFGVENGSPASALELLQDTQPATSAVLTSIRAGNFSTTVPGNANVDVYITPTTTQSLTGATPQFSNIPFGATDAYTQMAGGAYTVWVTPYNTPTQVLSHANITFNNATNSTIYVDDGSPSGTVPALDTVVDTY